MAVPSSVDANWAQSLGVLSLVVCLHPRSNANIIANARGLRRGRCIVASLGLKRDPQLECGSMSSSSLLDAYPRINAVDGLRLRNSSRRCGTSLIRCTDSSLPVPFPFFRSRLFVVLYFFFLLRALLDLSPRMNPLRNLH